MLEQFVKKYEWKVVDYDKSFWFQCLDVVRQRWKENWKPQAKALWARGVKFFALMPNTYLVKWQEYIANNIKLPNQVPLPWDVIIFSQPKLTWHIAIVLEAPKWENKLVIFEQNFWRWNSRWLWNDVCRKRTTTYRNVMWWITNV